MPLSARGEAAASARAFSKSRILLVFHLELHPLGVVKDALAQAGADIILGSHSHMVQPMQLVNVTRNDGTNKNVFIIYSLGNFLTSHDLEYTDAGIILDFTVQEQPNGTFEVVDIGYVPTYCWTHDGGVEVVPAKVYLENRPSNMSDASYQRMKSTYEGNVQLLGSDFKVLDK